MDESSYGSYFRTHMNRVGTKELKNRLSHYLRLVRAGARILITDHGRPVAEIGPVARVEGDPERAWRLAAAQGRATLPTREGFRRCRPIRLPGGVFLSDAVHEDRD